MFKSQYKGYCIPFQGVDASRKAKVCRVHLVISWLASMLCVLFGALALLVGQQKGIWLVKKPAPNVTHVLLTTQPSWEHLWKRTLVKQKLKVVNSSCLVCSINVTFQYVTFQLLHVLAKPSLTLLVGCQEEHLTCKKLNDEVLAWLSVWNKVKTICIWSSWCHCDPIVACFIKIRIGLTFLVPAYPGCSGKQATVYVCLCWIKPSGSPFVILHPVGERDSCDCASVDLIRTVSVQIEWSSFLRMHLSHLALLASGRAWVVSLQWLRFLWCWQGYFEVVYGCALLRIRLSLRSTTSPENQRMKSGSLLNRVTDTTVIIGFAVAENTGVLLSMW